MQSIILSGAKLLFLALLLSFQSNAHSKDDSETSNHYEVNLNVTSGAGQLPAPYLVLKAGRPASVTLTDETGEETTLSILIDEPSLLGLPHGSRSDIIGLLIDVESSSLDTLTSREILVGVVEGRSAEVSVSGSFELDVVVRQVSNDALLAMQSASECSVNEADVEASSTCCIAACPDGNAVRCCGASVCCLTYCNSCCFVMEP